MTQYIGNSFDSGVATLNLGVDKGTVINIGSKITDENLGGSTTTINDDLVVTGTTTATGQAEFTLVPHCNVVPTFSEDLTNKAYVDSRIASGGSNFFYFNYSVVSDVPIKQLGNSIVIAALQTVNTPQLGTQSIATFISDVGVPNITSIPSGIWELNQWGNAVGGHAGTLVYFFTLSTYRPSTGVTTLQGTSGNSAVISLTTPSLYFASLSLGTFAVALEDRIVIEVKSLGVGTGVNTLNSYYQDTYYSYLSCPIIEGTDLLNKNNTWTGSNSFLAVKTNTLQSNTGILTIGGDVTTTIAFTDNVTIGNMTLGTNNRINFSINSNVININTLTLGSPYTYTQFTPLTTVLPLQTNVFPDNWLRIYNKVANLGAYGSYIMTGILTFQSSSATPTTVDYIWINIGSQTVGDSTILKIRIPGGAVIDNLYKKLSVPISGQFSPGITLDTAIWASGSPSTIVLSADSSTIRFVRVG